MKRGFLVLGLAVVAGAANAVLVIPVGLAISENFDGMPGSTVTGLFPAGTPGAQVLVTGTTFDGARNGGTSTAAMNLFFDGGVSNSGAMRNLGNGASTERALGSLASGSHFPAFGVEIRNGSGNALTSITLRFTQENWRTSTSSTGTPNTTLAFWGRTGGGMTSADYLSSAAMTAETLLNLTGPAPVTTNGAIDGNLAINQVAKFHTFVLSTPLAVGDSLYVAFRDPDEQGNDAAIAIDQFDVTATAVPEPATMAVLGLGAAALLRRRRK